MAKKESKKENGIEYRPRLLEVYENVVIPKMMKIFKYENKYQVPKLEKITINMGIGRAKEDPQNLKNAMEDLKVISGQQPVITRAKKSISNFKIRAGDPVGCFVTLRGWRMYEFLDKFISIAVPRIRDFTGFSDKSFDGKGNLSIGIKEQIIFPEINYDTIDRIRGMDITITTTAETDEEAFELLSLMGFPFRRKRQPKIEEVEESN